MYRDKLSQDAVKAMRMYGDKVNEQFLHRMGGDHIYLAIKLSYFLFSFQSQIPLMR